VQWALTVMAAVTFYTTVHLSQRGCTHIFGNNKFLRQLPLIDADVNAVGREIPFFRDWFEHDVYDDYWAEVNAEEWLEEIDVPICQQAAWYDPYVDSMFRLYNGMRTRGRSERARRNQKIYVIPWTHHIPEGPKFGDIDFGPQGYVNLDLEDLRWFDYWLKGMDTGIMDEPPIKLFVMGRNEWRFENEWPLARTQFTPYYLHSQGNANTLYGNGILTPDSPGGEPPDQYDYDPDNPVPTLGGNNSTWTLMKFAAEPIYPGPIDQRSIERRDDVLVYTSPVLEADLEATGPLQMILYASSSARDTDFTAKLVDVFPDGRAIHLSEGILRARHRKSLKSIEFLQPGEIDDFRITMAPTSNVFLKGHRMRLEISSSNFPRFDRNLNTEDPIGFGTTWKIAHQTVMHNSRYASHILLPVIPS
jgi:putative CocE/NonD family hydrolase